MRYRPIGDTGIQTSVLGCGGFRLPTLESDGVTIDRMKAGEAFGYAFDHGVNFIDTSYVYHNGDSEKFIGEFLTAHGLRNQTVLCTKLPTWLVESPKDMERMIKEQLQRLRTDRLDFYLLHMLTADRWEKLKRLGVLSFLEGLLNDGLARHVGFSSHDVNSLSLLKDYDRFRLVVKQFNYLDRNLQGAEDVMKHSTEGGYGVAAMEPLRGGLLGERLPTHWLSSLRAIELDASPAAKGLFWVMSHEQVCVTLTGVSRLEHIKENIGTAELIESQQLGQNLSEQYDRATLDLKSKQVIPCTACRYCESHCPKRIPISYNLELLNFLAAELKVDRRSALLRMNAATVPHFRDYFSIVRYTTDLTESERAAACVGCRNCEDYCPQHIRIADELATMAYIARTDQLPKPSVPKDFKSLIWSSWLRRKIFPDSSLQARMAIRGWRFLTKNRFAERSPD